MTQRAEQGFTLVELAVVMIIIGLLIGGVLKGQELVGNAQITAAVAQVKGIDAATTTFRDKYDAFPGDMPNSATRLMNCTGFCSTGASSSMGDGRLDMHPQGAVTMEGLSFFPQMAAADLITGVTIVGGDSAWGQSFPATKMRGGFRPGYHRGGTNLGASTGSPPGHYLNWTRLPYPSPDASEVLTGIEALRIDRKIDDGINTSGSVVSANNGCTYDEQSTFQNCELFIRFQN